MSENSDGEKLAAARLQGQEVSYPLQLPIKVIGVNQAQLVETVIGICARCEHVITVDEVKTRPSSNERYLAMTFSFLANDREHLDQLYQEMMSHDLIKWVI